MAARVPVSTTTYEQGASWQAQSRPPASRRLTHPEDFCAGSLQLAVLVPEAADLLCASWGTGLQTPLPAIEIGDWQDGGGQAAGARSSRTLQEMPHNAQPPQKEMPVLRSLCLSMMPVLRSLPY